MATDAGTVLPSSVVLRPHHPLLQRASDAVQFGLGQHQGVEAAGLSPELLRFVRSLTPGEPVTPFDLVQRAVADGCTPEESLVLLQELFRQGALLDADLARRLVIARRAARVVVEGSGPLFAPVAVGLAVDGVGTLELRTRGAVSVEDLGTLSISELGLPRGEATAEAIGRVAPRTVVHTEPSPTRPDLVVFTDLLRPRPARHQDLLADGVTQLVVRASDGLGLVGPLVLPGRTACLRCLDLQHSARDAAWPSVAATLVDRSGSGSPATIAATAALAVEQALLALDSTVSASEPPPVLDAVLELDMRRGDIRRRAWEPHPRCGCGAGHTKGDSDGSTSDGGRLLGEDQPVGTPATCVTAAER
ncbi:TOMM precursor leader peptide-binding protein [Pseudonocardia spinosispora]|uniref:TOMM precursor leader peptide-binding protein n=1 Tax=Pseudonocardia spinosispora TaxID=103441 RepID=UPI000685B361|nr:TOMM precursor leader peptide-binding protein [Pseudonocardia spinosispora]